MKAKNEKLQGQVDALNSMQNKSLYGGFGVSGSSARPKGALDDVAEDEDGAEIPKEATEAPTLAKDEEAKEANRAD